MDDDDDKVLYPKIGKTEITIDKVLSNLLVNDVKLIININFRISKHIEIYIFKIQMETILRRKINSLV